MLLAVVAAVVFLLGFPVSAAVVAVRAVCLLERSLSFPARTGSRLEEEEGRTLTGRLLLFLAFLQSVVGAEEAPEVRARLEVPVVVLRAIRVPEGPGLLGRGTAAGLASLRLRTPPVEAVVGSLELVAMLLAVQTAATEVLAVPVSR